MIRHSTRLAEQRDPHRRGPEFRFRRREHLPDAPPLRRVARAGPWTTAIARRAARGCRRRSTSASPCCCGRISCGGFVFLPPFYIAAHLFPSCGERTIQRFNSRFYRGFFALVRALMPGHRWQVDPEVRAIRSSVIVCNHVSYLDSILMIALFDRHTTLVKSRLFDIPVFGTMLRWSGYIPAASEGRLAGLMVERVERRGTFWPEEGTCSFSRRAHAAATGRSGASTRGHSRSPATAGRRSGSSPSATPTGCSGRIRLRSLPAGPT